MGSDHYLDCVKILLNKVLNKFKLSLRGLWLVSSNYIHYSDKCSALLIVCFLINLGIQLGFCFVFCFYVRGRGQVVLITSCWNFIGVISICKSEYNYMYFPSLKVQAWVCIHYLTWFGHGNSCDLVAVKLIQREKEQFCFMFLFLGIAEFSFT